VNLDRGGDWPSVSAVVTTRDRPRELRRAIRAIFAQEYPAPLECVVVFDGREPEDLSDVAPNEMARSLVVIRNVRTSGLAGARNTGAERAGCDLLAFCDDDDEWLPGKLLAQTDVLEREGADVSVAGIEIEYEGRRVTRLPEGDRVTLEHLLRSRVMEIHPSTFVVRRGAFFDRVGPVDEQLPGSYGEDYEWLLRAAAVGPIAAVRRPLARVHWGASFFAERWDTIAEAIEYLLAKHPELAGERRNLARLQGRVAFANAALGRRGDAWRWAWRSIRTRPLERRPYLALAVSSGLVQAATIQERANRGGRSV
jgi:glycosyltransferase involved in cell wall biosynthesis